jgi:hypothetical protein
MTSRSTVSNHVKTIFAAAVILVCAVQSAAAGETVRDHRGANGDPEGGVTVNGAKATVGPAPKLGCEKCKGGFGGLSGSDNSDKGSGNTGVTIRDHR